MLSLVDLIGVLNCRSVELVLMEPNGNISRVCECEPRDHILRGYGERQVRFVSTSANPRSDNVGKITIGIR